ncbi:hypothetical protein RCG19_15895 [Neobacillus sp. OS1-2]|uniref:hypothetical protein n=1 Tax=Neobacillus sp. OS1-2 TaxID=3070680 RepID=UPI0027E1C808|nr:hypothetical protein [Neobacillus sp. OS1-2]WML38670.1 hypothetical protein RCG19_15895 [Neobacillus sp. OS1-2]
MKKDVTNRIAYYLKKVNERMSHHPAKKLPAKFTHRNERLMLYKTMMHRQIECEHPSVYKKYMG